jgi:DNA repair protein RadA/Sms
MAKSKSRTSWMCTECGATAAKWYGRCPDCGAWNSLEERSAAPDVSDGRARIDPQGAARGKPVAASAAAQEPRGDDGDPRARCGMGDVDRVLGGGLVAGSVVLLGGPPGIGKSTLLLQVAAGLAQRGTPVLYVSGEESVVQVGGRARRLGADVPGLSLLADTRVEVVLEAAEQACSPGASCLIVDSIQTLYAEQHEGLPGNVSQIRAVTAALLGFAKRRDVAVIVVGHVTKDGQLAGPRLLEHMVDVVLQFEGDDERALRLLRSTKNRFGSTAELGVFEMGADGLQPIVDPSRAFLAERPAGATGSCITATIEGSRPLLLEVQALLGECHGGSPRRTCVGLDAARVAMLLAVLDRHAQIPVTGYDVFANVAGGVRSSEPATDLAIALAVASSHLRRPLPVDLVAVGELGLTGEVRRVARLETRLAEAARLGFTRVVTPGRGSLGGASERRPAAPMPATGALEVIEVATIAEAVAAALGEP